MKNIKTLAHTILCALSVSVIHAHADVTSDKPGKCSKCGMDLVKKNK